MIAAIFFALIAQALAQGHMGGLCELPLQEDIDWDRLPTEWELVITDDPPPHDDMFKCIRATVTHTNDEPVIKMTGGDSKGGETSIIMKTWQVIGGGYQALVYPGHVSDQMIDLVLATIRKGETHAQLPVVGTTFLTDYENFFIILSCNQAGYHDIWVFAPNRDISVDQTLSFVNELRLHRGWRTQKLRTSVCPAPK